MIAKTFNSIQFIHFQVRLFEAKVPTGRISCQICRKKIQSESKYPLMSGLAEHMGTVGLCLSLLLAAKLILLPSGTGAD